MQRNSRKISLHKDLWTKANLTPKEVSRIEATLCQLHGNDTATPGLNLKRIQGAEPLRSVRVTDDIRMVLHLAGNEIIVLHVDRHDNAYEWARNNNGQDRLKSLTNPQNLRPYPSGKIASGPQPTMAGDSRPSGSFANLSGIGMSKPDSESNVSGRGRWIRNDRSADSSAMVGKLLDAALEAWQEPVADPSTVKQLYRAYSGPVLVLGAAGTDQLLTAVIRSVYLAEQFAGLGEQVLLLTDSVCAFEKAERFLKLLRERAEGEPDPRSAVEAVEVSLFDGWLECQVQDIDVEAAKSGREAPPTQGGATRDAACRLVHLGLEDGTLSPTTAAVVVLDCQNLGRQAVRLCRKLALTTVPKAERWNKSELERLCLIADPFQRTGGPHLNIQDCQVRPAKTIRLRQSGIVAQAVIDTAVSALTGQEFDDLTGGIATLDGYRSIESGRQPSFRRCANTKEGAQLVADWLHEVQEADEELKPGRVCLVARTNNRIKDWRKALRKLDVETRRLRHDSDVASSTGKVWVAKPEELDPELYFQGVAFLDADRKSWPRRKTLRQAVDETDRDAAARRERSLFYLACTRARRYLLFCSQGPLAPWLETLAPPVPESESEIKSSASPPARSQAMKYPVLIDQEITDAMLQVLHDQGCDTYMWNPGGETPRMEETVGFFVYGHALIDGPIMDRMPKLKVISNMGVGVDHIRVPDAAERGIAVGNTPGFVDGATADMAFLLMMAIARNLKKGIDYARGPEFRHFDPSLWHGKEINGATLGIFGMGAIGSTVARRASGFNMHVIYHNRNRLSDTREAELNAYWVPRSSLLARSDFLLLSLPLNEETESCMGLAEFRQMQEHAYLINIGRGGLVRTDELATALEEGQLAGAALDVTEPEPLPRDHPLVEHPDVIITPHLGSATVESREGMFIRTVENLMAGMQDKPLLSQVFQ